MINFQELKDKIEEINRGLADWQASYEIRWLDTSCCLEFCSDRHQFCFGLEYAGVLKTETNRFNKKQKAMLCDALADFFVSPRVIVIDDLDDLERATDSVIHKLRVEEYMAGKPK